MRTRSSRSLLSANRIPRRPPSKLYVTCPESEISLVLNHPVAKQLLYDDGAVGVEAKGVEALVDDHADERVHDGGEEVGLRRQGQQIGVVRGTESKSSYRAHQRKEKSTGGDALQ